MDCRFSCPILRNAQKSATGRTPQRWVFDWVVGFRLERYIIPQSGGAVDAGAVRFITTYLGADGSYGGYSPAGNTETVAWVTDADGFFEDANGRSPADWSFNWTSSGAYSQCSTAPDNGAQLFIVPVAVAENDIGCYQVNLPSGPQVELDMDSPNVQVRFSPIEEPNPGPSVNVTGSGFDTTYGMPVIHVYDAYGNQLASVTATSASPTIISAPSSGFSAMDYGTYYGFVLNTDSAGNLYPVGTGTITKTCTLPKGESCD